MLTAIPDVVSDSCTDAARRLGVTMETLFLKAAEGFTNYDEVGARWYNVWKRSGYNCLPPKAKEFILAVMDGAYHPPPCGECGIGGGCHHSH